MSCSNKEKLMKGIARDQGVAAEKYMWLIAAVDY
jgi:hypothetical protein